MSSFIFLSFVIFLGNFYSIFIDRVFTQFMCSICGLYLITRSHFLQMPLSLFYTCTKCQQSLFIIGISTHSSGCEIPVWYVRLSGRLGGVSPPAAWNASLLHRWSAWRHHAIMRLLAGLLDEVRYINSLSYRGLRYIWLLLADFCHIEAWNTPLMTQIKAWNACRRPSFQTWSNISNRLGTHHS